MPKISLILHDIRSIHNVGSILRSAECFDVEAVYVGGYTPYPQIMGDKRLPHIQLRQTKQIAKTSLGAEKSLSINRYESINTLIDDLKQSSYHIVALEQDPKSTKLTDYKTPSNIALVIGREVEGVSPQILNLCDDIIEIPLFGTKESLNVSVATAIALYQLHG